MHISMRQASTRANNQKKKKKEKKFFSRFAYTSTTPGMFFIEFSQFRRKHIFKIKISYRGKNI